MTAILATTKSLRTTVDGTLVVSFEIAPQDAPAAFTAFGLTGTNVGIAPITGDAARDATVRAASTVSEEPFKRSEQEEPEPRTSFLQLKRTAQCAIRCKEPMFWRFLNTHYDMPFDVDGEEIAIEAVRNLCVVISRSEFNTDERAASNWDDMEAEYYAWAHGRR